MMGGCRCSFKNCQNTTKTTNLHFFHYPVKQKERCRKWILEAEKPHFVELDEHQLRNKVICQRHFRDDCFLNSTKKRLSPNAIPTLDGYDEPDEVKCEDGFYSKTGPVSFKSFNSAVQEDVKVLPVSDDGSLFILDTIPTYHISKKVKSYILNTDPLNDNQCDVTEVKCEYAMDDSSDNLLNSQDDNHESLQESKLNSPGISGNSVTPKKIDEELENLICKTVETKYLDKLEQHTNDLNQIVKMLKAKNGNKLNRSSILRYLKLRLPPTLFTLVSMTLNEEYQLTEADEIFFKDLHESSAKTYQFLMEDCGWRMPIVEVHEGEPEEMEEV